MKKILEHILSVRDDSCESGVNKRYQCSICVFSSLKLSNVKRHILTHTGVQPFRCLICERRFTQKTSLISHMVVHSGERPFICSVCDKAFTQKGTLNRHMLAHCGNLEISKKKTKREHIY
ncbi:hypothetical protein CDAR_534991 [Caerostris darwini]|uniref:C2H2-type domain-containing protein n=1 Tax=Caerostris darwini TaxID=1538125 RepID=A0AAV4QHF2_9ARAC|nr:hypothetical protein CDAR_534991 [Caerostris darwini]